MLDTKRLHATKIILPATLLTVAATVLLPLLVHSVPMSGLPLGARLLPIFIAPLVAVFLFHPVVSVVASLISPYLNQQLTGNPVGPMMPTLTVELSVFSVLCLLLLRHYPKLWFAAPLAYIVAKAAAQVVLKTGGLVPTPPWSGFFPSLVVALPGLIILLVINIVLVRSRHGLWSGR